MRVGSGFGRRDLLRARVDAPYGCDRLKVYLAERHSGFCRCSPKRIHPAVTLRLSACVDTPFSFGYHDVFLVHEDPDRREVGREAGAVGVTSKRTRTRGNLVMTATVERTIVGLGAGEPDEELRRGNCSTYSLLAAGPHVTRLSVLQELVDGTKPRDRETFGTVEEAPF